MSEERNVSLVPADWIVFASIAIIALLSLAELRRIADSLETLTAQPVTVDAKVNIVEKPPAAGSEEK